MATKSMLTLLATLTFFNISIAQSFLLPPKDFFDGTKPAVIVKLKNGEYLKGKIDLMKVLKRDAPIFDLEDGGELDLSSDEVLEYYHPISKTSKIFSRINSKSLYTNEALGIFDNNTSTAGFVVVRIVEVTRRERTIERIGNTTSLYLLNPDFASRIQVYSANDDDDSKVSVRLESEWATFVPGSYLVAKDGNPAYRVRKTKYKTAFQELFGDCPILSRIEKPNFKDFAEHVYFYSNNCE